MHVGIFNFPLKYGSKIMDRRSFMGNAILGAAGVATGATGLIGCATQRKGFGTLTTPTQTGTGESRVSFVTGNDRRDMVYNALKPFREDIEQSIRGRQVIVKINMVLHTNPLCATHPDAVRGLLDFLKPMYDRPIVIAESTASEEGTMATFDTYGYKPVAREYNARLVELNDSPTTRHWIIDKNLNPVPVRIIDTLLDHDRNYIFSICRLKTHNRVVATLSCKNMVMGSPLKIPAKGINDKKLMHAEHTTPKTINFNIFKIAHSVYPDFAVLDGLVGMEGSGPANGEPVEHGVALAGPDYVAVDRVGIELMGIPYEDVAYLQWITNAGLGQGDMSKIQIIGSNTKQHVIRYKLHENIEWQYRWKEDLKVQS